jgi:hypothetical protein
VQHDFVDEQPGSFNLSSVDKAKAESLDLHSDLLEFLGNDKVTLDFDPVATVHRQTPFAKQMSQFN